MTPGFEKSLLKTLRDNYPHAGQRSDVQKSCLQLCSEQKLILKASVIQRVKEAVQDLYDFSRTEAYQETLLNSLPPEESEILNANISNSSVLMAYDFHYDPESDQLSLIEINTNASGFLFADLAYQTHGIEAWTDSRSRLLESFQEDGLNDRVSIVDESPEAQKMFPEFLLYQEWFQQNDIQATIVDTKTPDWSDHLENFVYNRFNDFVLVSPESCGFRKKYLSKSIVLSPNPKEFILLADKLRLLEFTKANVSDVLIPILEFSDFESPSEIWSKRKKYFFKPKRLFGGKAVFKGASISRKRFDTLVFQDYLAQEIRPAGLYNGFKFDMRFFTYKSQIQMGVARFYKGQLLNFDDPDGGLAPIVLN